MQRSWRGVGFLAPVALLLLLITTNVRLVANSVTVYSALFERHGVAERAGITPEGLRGVARQVQAYFNTPIEPLQATAEVNGAERELFRPAEVSHMADVKQLFGRTYRTQAAAGLFLVLVTLIAAVSQRRAALSTIASWLRRGALLTAGVILVLGIVSVVAFDPLFTAFHYIGFPQGNFLFNTSSDYLVLIFPFGFWRDVTLLIALLVLAESAVLFLAARGLTRIERQAGARPERTAQPDRSGGR